MTNNIKVVDVIEEGKQEENESVKPIPEEVKNEAVVEQPVEQPDEIVSALPVVQSTRAGLLDNPPEQVKPEPKKKEPPIPLDQPVKQNVRQQDKLVKCPQCDKQMKLKSYRYKHELTCKGKLEDIPRKPKAMPKPKAQPIEQEEEIEEVIQPKPKLTPPKGVERSNDVKLTEFHKLRDLTQPVSNQILKPQTPNLVDFASHYQLLQNQFMQQKKEKYNNLCQNMFSSKSKKR